MIRNHVTIKFKDRYYRILKIEEGEDGSVYIWRKFGNQWYAHLSYHDGRISGDGKNFGYRRHQKIGVGKSERKVIADSIRYANLKLKDRRQVLQVYHWSALRPDFKISRNEIDATDLIFEIEELFEKYEILISVNRDDLMKKTDFFQTQKCNILSSDFYITLNNRSYPCSQNQIL